MHYAVRRIHELELRAAYGALLRSRERRRARVYADVRVGNHRFDNVIDGGLGTRADERESAEWLDAPDDLDPTALQVGLWKLTQIKYDEALQDYYDHKKALVTEYLRDEVEAFTRERALRRVDELRDGRFPRAEWEDALREVSRRFLQHPEAYDPAVGLHAERVQRWFVSSEGARVVTEDVYVEVDVVGWVLTDDGVYTEASRQVHARDLTDVPGRDVLARLVDDVLGELAELRDAESPGAIIGPALLGGQATSTLVHEALGHRLEGERLVARGETRTFARKLGERILPEGLHVYDDPTIRRFEETPVWGSYAVDDQGVPAQRADLVRDGMLVGFLRSRTPLPERGSSNGHARHDGVEPPTARMGNLVVEADPKRAQSWPELERRLLELARAQGRKHAILVRRIRGGETATSSYDFQVFKGEPAEVYRIDVETGERTRVRDVDLIGTPLSALQRIVAFGGPSEIDQGFCYAESGSIPVSGIAPAILLGELELQQRSSSGFHEPLLPPPFADDGSRGRTGGLRQRGQRRKRGAGPRPR
jgi:predicted Zn-dependent protease